MVSYSFQDGRQVWGGGQGKDKGQALGSHQHPHGTRTPRGPVSRPLALPVKVPRASASFLLTTDLRMLTRGLGMGLEGLFSKLSGSVEEWPPFLAWSASW